MQFVDFLFKIYLLQAISLNGSSHHNRLNPENGLCLCNIHDRAFELGYIGIKSDYSILISNELKQIREKETFSSLWKTRTSINSIA